MSITLLLLLKQQERLHQEREKEEENKRRIQCGEPTLKQELAKRDREIERDQVQNISQQKSSAQPFMFGLIIGTIIGVIIML